MDILNEAQIEQILSEAFEKKQFAVYYQPQYNHSTGTVIGAEALARLVHPEYGVIGPAYFIPTLERNGLITEFDLYVFDCVCALLRKCIDSGIPTVPVSVNITRPDVVSAGFAGKIEALRRKYDIPSKLLRMEITESSATGGLTEINDVLDELHSYGYIVEMDDFGSGYSSLNVLKDMNVDVLKLDMAFLQGNLGGRGGTIVSSVIRMAKWLGMPVIAEGVETADQADFLRSIGCDYIQGYLYSKPLPEENFLKLLSGRSIGAITPQLHLIETLNAGNFWDPDSLETLIFSNYVGGAAIFDYDGKNLELLRVNTKYLQELGMNMTEKEIITRDPWEGFSEENRKIYEDTLRRAIETENEEECETWRVITSECCGSERLCIRSTIRMIGKSKDAYLFYVMVRNITAERTKMNGILDSERRFKAASEQANIYYWEYTVATKEMRPCFRCMRDLGLPAIVRNYPDSAIEAGIFPPEIADSYRELMRKIDSGELTEVDTVIPLTVGRVPFHVRYTMEYDKQGHTVKAYGSATLVVDK